MKNFFRKDDGAVNERYRSHDCGALREEDIGTTARLAGWAETFRDHGGVMFVDLRDHYGVTQLVLHDSALTHGITRESVVAVEGAVVARSPETVNPKLATGHVELHVTALKLLSQRPQNLPFEVGNSDNIREDLRLRYRYLDLRGARQQRNLQKRAAVLKAMRKIMEDYGFLEVQTPILTASSPEGARDFLVPSRKYKGKFYALPQAPQQFKQLLMLSGVDRYYQIAPCFRDEDARNDRTPGEFYQLDFELAFATQEDVFRVAETTLHQIFSEFAPEKTSHITGIPFPIIPYKEAIQRYGTDKPDLRNPLFLENLSTFFSDIEFKPFQGRSVQAIRAPGCFKQPKSFFEQMLQFATSIGMQGLGYISITEEHEFKGPIAKFLDNKKRNEFCKIMEIKPCDSVFFICDQPGLCETLAGQIRNELGRRLDLIDETRFDFCFITDFPMYERDEQGRLAFTHNPFSMPQGGLETLQTQDPLDILAHQFDVVVNGVELSSGAVRNHLPEVMTAAFDLAGYSAEELETRFRALFQAFQHGAPPHAGMAHGIDRMLMLLLDEESIREVQAFPMNGSAQDLLLGAPGDVSEAQLREVHIKVR